MTRAISFALLPLLLLLVLAGCVSGDGPTTPKALCKALLTPLEYTSTNPKSRRYAGPDLAPDIAQHNHVGINLRCPAYRVW